MSENCLAERVLDIQDPTDIDGSMLRAYRALSGPDCTMEDLRAEEHLVKMQWENMDIDWATEWHTVPREIDEAGVTLFILGQILKDRKMHTMNVLHSWPMYDRLYRTYVEPAEANDARTPEPGTNNSLLVGALSQLTSKAFEALAEDVYQTDYSFVVDVLCGPDKSRHSTFIKGDGLHLPFRTNSMRIVQTNLLMWMLLDKGEVAPNPDSIGRLLKEAHRVLRPGGHLLLREISPDIDLEAEGGCLAEENQRRASEFNALLASLLDEAGFKGSVLEQVYDPEGVDFLYDPTRNFSQYPMSVQTNSVAIYARK